MSETIEERPLEVYAANLGDPTSMKIRIIRYHSLKSRSVPVTSLRDASKTAVTRPSTSGARTWAGGVVRRREQQAHVMRINHNG